MRDKVGSWEGLKYGIGRLRCLGKLRATWQYGFRYGRRREGSSRDHYGELEFKAGTASYSYIRFPVRSKSNIA